MKKSTLLTAFAALAVASTSMGAVTINLSGNPNSGPQFFTGPGVVVPDGSLIRLGTFATAPAANVGFAAAEAAFSEFARTTMGRDNITTPTLGHPVRNNIAGSPDAVTSPQPDSFFIGKNVYVWVYGGTAQDPTANQGIYSTALVYADQPTALSTSTTSYLNAFGSFAPLGQAGQQNATVAINTALTPNEATSFLLASLVPEPSSLTLGLFAALGLLRRRR